MILDAVVKLAWLREHPELFSNEENERIAHLNHWLHYSPKQRAEIDNLIERAMPVIYGSGKRLDKSESAKAATYEEWVAWRSKAQEDAKERQLRRLRQSREYSWGDNDKGIEDGQST